MFSVVEQSKDFEEFLEFLGTKVTLNGWDKFRGGLDHRGSDLTGTHSYYTQFQGNEIMYHVATMMPWNDVRIPHLPLSFNSNPSNPAFPHLPSLFTLRTQPLILLPSFLLPHRAFPYLNLLLSIERPFTKAPSWQ